MSEFEYLSCDEAILQVLLESPLWLNEIQRKTRKNKRYVINQLEYLRKQGLIRSWEERKKKFYELTPKGTSACVYYRIRREAGYSGIEWAKKMFEKGYEIRFLSDFTGMGSHRRWLFAWNPLSGDCDLALIFGVKSVKSKTDSPGYVAQYVDREKDPQKPIRSNALFDFVKSNVKNFGDEEQLAKALKTFWDPSVHNSFLCVLLPPEDVTFGFPHEIGHFNSMAFVGFGYQESFPFIPKMNFISGTLNLSKNFRVKIDYWMNLVLQHCLIWAELKNNFDPPDDPAKKEALGEYIKKLREALLQGESGKNPIMKIGVSCRHGDYANCKKMGIKCLALENGEVDFRKCPILMDEIQKIATTYVMVGSTETSIGNIETSNS